MTPSCMMPYVAYYRVSTEGELLAEFTEVESGKKADRRIAMFELTVEDDDVKVVDEKHYLLVPADQLDRDGIRNYRG